MPYAGLSTRLTDDTAPLVRQQGGDQGQVFFMVGSEDVVLDQSLLPS